MNLASASESFRSGFNDLRSLLLACPNRVTFLGLTSIHSSLPTKYCWCCYWKGRPLDIKASNESPNYRLPRCLQGPRSPPESLLAATNKLDTLQLGNNTFVVNHQTALPTTYSIRLQTSSPKWEFVPCKYTSGRYTTDVLVLVSLVHIILVRSSPFPFGLQQRRNWIATNLPRSHWLVYGPSYSMQEHPLGECYRKLVRKPLFVTDFEAIGLFADALRQAEIHRWS